MSTAIHLTEDTSGVDWSVFCALFQRAAYMLQDDFNAWSSMGYFDEVQHQS